MKSRLLRLAILACLGPAFAFANSYTCVSGDCENGFGKRVFAGAS